MVAYDKGHVSAVGDMQELIIETATIVCSLSEAIKNLNCPEEEKEEHLAKLRYAVNFALENPDNVLKPKGFVIEY